MENFLVIINRNFKVLDVLWSEPVFLVSRQNNSFLNLFIDADHSKLKSITMQKKEAGDIFQRPLNLTLSGLNKRISLCFMNMGDNILVFAMSDQIRNKILSSDIKQIIYDFMKTIKNYSSSSRVNIQESVSMQFERIQKLNNELINTKRLLEKSNAKLKVLNEDLNNRLVKDALTGLVSRYQYREEMQLTISSAQDKKGVFFFIDIDDFKRVNDSYGHAFGDRYLIEFSERLKNLSVNNSVLMRISGDEFGIFIYGYDCIRKTDINDLWEKIESKVLSKPVIIDNNSIPLSISAGAAIYGVHTDEIYRLIEYADFAMYRAKRSGKNKMNIFNLEEYIEAKEKANGE